MVIVNSLDDLLKIGVESVMGSLQVNQIEFNENLVVKIQIRGESWSELIDYRIAEYVIDLQKAANRLYTEIHGEGTSSQKLNKMITMKVRIYKGSSIFEINFTEVLCKMVGNMTGGETLILAGICAGTILSFYGIKKLSDFKTATRVAAIASGKDQQIVDRLSSTIDKALDVIDKQGFESPTRKLIHRLDSSDTISLPEAENLTVEQAKAKYPHKTRAKNLTGIFDATYKIKNIDMDQIPPALTIDYNGFEFKALAELANVDIEQIADSFEKAWKSKDNLTIPLHVFMIYNEKRIIAASIIGIGAPRENTEDIMVLIQKW